jgi:DNA-binding MarR family transcriptional regulator
MPPMPRAKAPPPDLADMPGHQIRRLQQIAVAIFLQDTEAFGITPVQYAALRAMAIHPGIDQRTLAGKIGLDASTLGGVVDRLEGRGLLARTASVEDRRVRQLALTAEGADLVRVMEPALKRSQERILAPLKPAERKEFVRMLGVLVNTNNELSRAPVPHADA